MFRPVLGGLRLAPLVNCPISKIVRGHGGLPLVGRGRKARTLQPDRQTGPHGSRRIRRGALLAALATLASCLQLRHLDGARRPPRRRCRRARGDRSARRAVSAPAPRSRGGRRSPPLRLPRPAAPPPPLRRRRPPPAHRSGAVDRRSRSGAVDRPRRVGHSRSVHRTGRDGGDAGCRPGRQGRDGGDPGRRPGRQGCGSGSGAGDAGDCSGGEGCGAGHAGDRSGREGCGAGHAGCRCSGDEGRRPGRAGCGAGRAVGGRPGRAGRCSGREGCGAGRAGWPPRSRRSLLRS